MTTHKSHAYTSEIERVVLFFFFFYVCCFLQNRAYPRTYIEQYVRHLSRLSSPSVHRFFFFLERRLPLSCAPSSVCRAPLVVFWGLATSVPEEGIQSNVFFSPSRCHSFLLPFVLASCATLVTPPKLTCYGTFGSTKFRHIKDSVASLSVCYGEACMGCLFVLSDLFVPFISSTEGFDLPKQLPPSFSSFCRSGLVVRTHTIHSSLSSFVPPFLLQLHSCDLRLLWVSKYSFSSFFPLRMRVSPSSPVCGIFPASPTSSPPRSVSCGFARL